MKEFKVGQIWIGNENNRKIEILKIEFDRVQYRDLKYGTVFNMSKKVLQRCDISLAKW